MIAVSPWPRRKRATPPRKASHNGPPLARLSSFPRCAAGGRSHPRARFRVAEQLRAGRCGSSIRCERERQKET
jgi:hypothetical protein